MVSDSVNCILYRPLIPEHEHFGNFTNFVIPERFVTTRYGIDYVRIRTASGDADVPVQRGRAAPSRDMPDGLEILSGLKASDKLVRP